MIRQATADGFVTQDPFAGLKWPKPRTPEPDPFTAEERTRMIRWFAEKEFSFYAGRATEGPRRRPHPPYHAFVYVLFWTGLRSSVPPDTFLVPSGLLLIYMGLEYLILGIGIVSDRPLVVLTRRDSDLAAAV